MQSSACHTAQGPELAHYQCPQVHAKQQGASSALGSKPVGLNVPNVVSRNTVLQVVVTLTIKSFHCYLIINFATVKNYDVDI